MDTSVFYTQNGQLLVVKFWNYTQLIHRKLLIVSLLTLHLMHQDLTIAEGFLRVQTTYWGFFWILHCHSINLKSFVLPKR